MKSKSMVLAGLLMISQTPVDYSYSDINANKSAYIKQMEESDFLPLDLDAEQETVQLQPGSNAKTNTNNNAGTGDTGKYKTRTMKVTYYCPCSKCNGNSLRRGKWGAYLREGMVASKDLPRGTKVIIKGKTYVVEDRCAKSGVIDIFVDKPHSRVYNMGSFRTTVKILV